MTELSGVVSVVLPDGVGAEFATLSVLPGLELKVADGAAPVVVGDGHCALVCLVVDDLSAEVPLLLLLEALEDVVGADLHHVDLVIDAVIAALRLKSMGLVLVNFSIAF